MRSFRMLFASSGGSSARAFAGGAALAASVVVGPAYAQAPFTPPGQPPATGAAPGVLPNAPPPVHPTAPSANGRAPAAGAAAVPGADVPPVSTGSAASAGSSLSADRVGQRAMMTSYQAKAAEQTVLGATARAEQQWTNYLPKIGLVGRYTRLSSFTPPSITGGGSLVGTTAPADTVNPTPTFALGGFTFPIVLDNYLLQATIAVPISDYFYRIGKAYTAATRSEEAARFDVVAARAKSYADGKVAYFTWLRARGAVGVAEQSLAVARAHQKDAENQFTVGNASKADVLRAQTQVAAAELQVARAKSGVVITERQVRVAMHARDEETFEPAEVLETPLAPPTGALRQLVSEAHEQRPEIKSIDKNAEAARKLADVQRAGRLPVVSGFGDVTYANPNQRRFPQTEVWFPTWAVGAQVTWSPNDILVAGAGVSDAEARASGLDAQKSTVRDGIEVEVTQAYQGIVEADTAILTTTRQLESSVEGYRVARELFNNGRGTGTTLIDAETILAQTRFEHLNARVDARIARVRLEHALGRDARLANPTQ